MAYATIADLPVEVGLYTCMVPMVVYAAARRVAHAVGEHDLDDRRAHRVDAARRRRRRGRRRPGSGDLATLTLLVGVILLVARLLRLGALIDNISEATLTGIKIGVGLTVAAGQLPKLLGIPGDPTADNFFAEMRAVVDHLDDISWATVVFSVGTLAVLLGLAPGGPRSPGPARRGRRRHRARRRWPRSTSTASP